MTVDEDTLREIKKLSKILTISNGEVLEKELSKYATTPDRKKIWVLIDGKNQTKEIMQLTGAAKRTVDAFLQTLENATLIERERNKPPKRILDYVPPRWLDLVQIDFKSNEMGAQNETSTQENQLQKETSQGV